MTFQRGRTLEELEEVFDRPWPARASAQKVKVVIKEGGNGTDVAVLDGDKH